MKRKKGGEGLLFPLSNLLSMNYNVFKLEDTLLRMTKTKQTEQNINYKTPKDKNQTKHVIVFYQCWLCCPLAK